jgi:hypothetical protein
MFQEGSVVTCDHRTIEQAMSKIVERRRKLGRYAVDAPDGAACWHVLLIEPQHENVAAAHLAGRGFGVYLPTVTVIDRKDRGKFKDVPMFRGYLFTFVWDIWKHYRRIMACPGVIGPLMVGEQAGVLTDSEIDLIQAQEGGMISKPRKRKRRWRRDIQSPSIAADPQEIVRINTYSALADLKGLDAAGRVGALRKALGLSAA